MSIEDQANRYELWQARRDGDQQALEHGYFSTEASSAYEYAHTAFRVFVESD